MKGVPVINLDNAAAPIEGDFLCALATQDMVEPRILGQSATATISTNTATVLFTGNNLVLKGDMTRRVLLCRIDPRCERPDTREFKRQLKPWVLENRTRLLSAALTALRAYVCARRPAHGKAPYGSFEEWDALVRGALLWLEQPDPLESRERIVAADPVATGLRALLETWFGVFGRRSATVREAKEIATPDNQGNYSHPEGDRFRNVLLDIAATPDGDSISIRKLGNQLRIHRDKVSGGFRLEMDGERQNYALWRVVSTNSRDSSDSGDSISTTRGNLADKENAKNIGRAETDSPDSPDSPITPQAENCYACVHFRVRSYTCPHVLTGIADPTTPPCGKHHFEPKL